MYELLRRSAERPWAVRLEAHGPTLDAAPDALILRMQENRSLLGREARVCVGVLGGLLTIAALLPALNGHWLVAIYAIAAMAALTFALDRHGRSRPASELLELADGRVRHRDGAGRITEYAAGWPRLAAEAEGLAGLRLVLRCRDGAIEFGHCLSLDERRAVAPLLAATLAEARRCGA